MRKKERPKISKQNRFILLTPNCVHNKNVESQHSSPKKQTTKNGRRKQQRKKNQIFGMPKT